MRPLTALITCLLAISPGVCLADNPLVVDDAYVVAHGNYVIGNYESDNPSVSTITVTTTKGITIFHCFITGKGPFLISAPNAGTNFTVQDSWFVGQNPNVNGQVKPGAMQVSVPAALSVYGNSVKGCSGGIAVLGNGPTTAKVDLFWNYMVDFDSRKSNGNGGYQSTNGFSWASFALQNLNADPNISIGFNEVINHEGASYPGGDLINIFKTSGTQSHPVDVGYNYLQGSFPGDLTSSTWYGNGVVMDGPTSDVNQATQWVNVHDNRIVQASIALGYAGLNNSAYNNTVVGSGLTPSGSFFNFWAAGVSNQNEASPSPSSWSATDSIHDNTVGFMNPQGQVRNDYVFSGGGNNYNNSSYAAGAITKKQEAIELRNFEDTNAVNGYLSHIGADW